MNLKTGPFDLDHQSQIGIQTRLFLITPPNLHRSSTGSEVRGGGFGGVSNANKGPCLISLVLDALYDIMMSMIY